MSSFISIGRSLVSMEKGKQQNREALVVLRFLCILFNATNLKKEARKVNLFKTGRFLCGQNH